MAPFGLGPMAIVNTVVASQVARSLAGRDQVVGGNAVLGVRQFDLVDGRSGGLEGGERRLDAGGHLRIEAGTVVGGDPADSQARKRFVQQLRVGGHLRRQRGRVAGVVAGDRLHHQGTVGSRPGQGADLVEARGEGDQSPPADPPVGRLEAGDAAEPGGLADGAAGVGADRHRRQIRRDAGGGAAAGAARGPLQIPGVADRPIGRVFVGTPHRELVHVGLADDHSIGRSQPGDRIGVIGRLVAGQHPGAAGGRHVDRAERVLDGDRQAGQRAQGVAGRPSRVDLLRLGDRRPAVRRQKGVDRAVERRDPIQKGFCACPGSQVSPPDGGDQFDGGEFGGLHA